MQIVRIVHIRAQFNEILETLLYSLAIIFSKLFSKRCTFGPKSGTKSLVCRYQPKFAKTVPELLSICLVISFIHIIQLSLLGSEYLPIAGKKVNIHYWMIRAIWIMWIKNITEHKIFKTLYKPNMTAFKCSGIVFCEFRLVWTYQRFSAAFLPKSAPFWK